MKAILQLKPVNPRATFSLLDLRIMAMDPGLLAAASDYAKRFNPRTTLARAA